MVWHILAWELRRKKTTNAILLLFIVLASLFIASAANNIYSITTALDSYFEKANLADYFIMVISNEENDAQLNHLLDTSEALTSYVKDECVYASNQTFRKADGTAPEFSNVALIASLAHTSQRFFDENNHVVDTVKENELYVPIALMKTEGLAVGDTLSICIGEREWKFSVAGGVKDAMLGAKLMSVNRFLISETAYEEIKAVSEGQQGAIICVRTEKEEAFRQALFQAEVQSFFEGSRSTIAFSYVMDMVLAAIFLVVSVVLILISLLILRFSILFTLTEEYREIGIMKAIGLRSGRIRSLYLVKYLAFSAVGAGLGFLASLPFSRLLLASVSQNIVMERAGGSALLNLLSVMFVIAVILLFCFGCTGKIKRFSPLTAIRSGSAGERYTKKGMLRLHRTRLRAALFLAINDILSEPKRFAVLLVVFVLGTLLMILPQNALHTLSDDSVVSLFGTADHAQLFLSDTGKEMELMVSERQETEQYLTEIKERLADAGIPAEVFKDVIFEAKLTHGEVKATAQAVQAVFLSAECYEYLEGEAPILANEIAITKRTADQLGAKLGDTITVTIGAFCKEFLVTALFQTMNFMGESLRFSETCTELPYELAIGGIAVQVFFTDTPTDKELEARTALLAEWYPNAELLDKDGYIKSFLSDIVEQLDSVGLLIIVVVVLIDALVAVLMVKSFLTKEKGEIALLKSLGFADGTLLGWQTLRIGIIMLLAVVIGALLSGPVSQVSIALIFQMMGLTQVRFVIRPLEVFVLYPSIVFCATMLMSVLAALQLKRINPREAGGVE